MFLSSRVVWAQKYPEPPFWVLIHHPSVCNLYPGFCLIISETQVFGIWFLHPILLHVVVRVGLDGIYLLSQSRRINLNHPIESVREEALLVTLPLLSVGWFWDYPELPLFVI